MTTRLKLYNAALRMCGERSLASLTEAREPRYLLDEVWSDGGVNACLEQGFWRFAKQVVMLDYDTNVTPAYGYARAFSRPTDYVKTIAVCSDENFKVPLLQYTYENGYWYANVDQIYVQYVSNDAAFGNDLSIWTQAFADFAAAHFASKIALKLTGSTEKQDAIEKKTERLLLAAKNLDASNDPTKFPAPGNWVTSRYSRGRNNDRGNTGSLIG